MALRATSTARPLSPPLTPPLTPPTKAVAIPPKVKISSSRSHQLAPGAHSLSLPATAVLPLLALFATADESRAEILPKEQIVSSLTKVESAIDQIREVGLSFFITAGQVVGAVTGAVKPGVDVALPILKQAGEEAVKIASPLITEASKKAQEAIQSSGMDTQPVITAAKTVAYAAQQKTKIINEAKPIATSTVETNHQRTLLQFW